RKNADTIRGHFALFEGKEDAELLFWFGQAWMARVGLLKDQPAIVGELFIGVAAMERSVELNPTFNAGSGYAVLGAYHARTRMAELGEAKADFEKAIELSGGKNLLVKFNYAARYHCMKQDRTAYTNVLEEIVAAGDIVPELRLLNTIAKRRARRFLSEKRMARCGFPQ
ncbi:MAG: TRAP transporter TatT component family protein, partial [Myxococcota bacterium]